MLAKDFTSARHYQNVIITLEQSSLSIVTYFSHSEILDSLDLFYFPSNMSDRDRVVYVYVCLCLFIPVIPRWYVSIFQKERKHMMQIYILIHDA